MNDSQHSGGLVTWGLSSLIGGALGVIASVALGGVFRFGIVLNAILCAAGAGITRWTGRELMRPEAKHGGFVRADAIWSAAGALLVLLLGAFGGFAD